VAETPTLLVLDNLEQVIGVGPELDQLLARCPGLKILATSRTVLRLRAEREYPVGPLTVPRFASHPSPPASSAVPRPPRHSRSWRRCPPCNCSSIEPVPCATTSP